MRICDTSKKLEVADWPSDALGLAIAADRSGQELIVGRDAGEDLGLVAHVRVDRPGKVIAAAIAVVRCMECHESGLGSPTAGGGARSG